MDAMGCDLQNNSRQELFSFEVNSLNQLPQTAQQTLAGLHTGAIDNYRRDRQ